MRARPRSDHAADRACTRAAAPRPDNVRVAIMWPKPNAVLHTRNVTVEVMVAGMRVPEEGDVTYFMDDPEEVRGAKPRAALRSPG